MGGADTLSFVIDGVLAGAARPRVTDGESDDLARFAAAGVGAVVSLTRDPLDREALGRAGLRSCHVPVEDFGAPSIEQIRRFVGFVDEVRASGGGAVVVHCGAGLGRTGTMLASYLVSRGRSADEAIAEVRRARPGSLESSEQEGAVRLWEAVLRDERRRQGGAEG